MQFLNNYDFSSSIEEMWNFISTTLNKILQSSVPSKITTSRFNQPWINREIMVHSLLLSFFIKALLRRKKRQFIKAKSTKISKDKKDNNI